MKLQAMTSPNQFQNLGIGWNWDGDTLTKANGFLFQLEYPLFLVWFKILLEVLTCLRSLTLKLQMEAIDVLYAYKEVGAVVPTLKNMRSESEQLFRRLFTETTQLGKDLMVKSLSRRSQESTAGKPSEAMSRLQLLSNTIA